MRDKNRRPTHSRDLPLREPVKRIYDQVDLPADRGGVQNGVTNGRLR